MSSLHGVHDAYQNLDRLGDQWAKLSELVDFETYRESLEACWRKPGDAAKGGRPPWDAVMMFKILLIGIKPDASDEKLEYMVTDSLTLKRFLGLDMEATAPDRTTIARYRSLLEASDVRDVFELLHDQLEAAGYRAQEGQMLDSSFVLVPIQRNTRDENQTLKDDEVPAAWEEDEATAKLRQKDTDARWTKKHGKSFFGYKNHVCVDVKHKLVRGYATTAAKDGDITVMLDLVDPMQRGECLWVDAAYRSKEEGKAQPAETNARVEHVFGSMQNETGGKFIRTIGKRRASIQIGLLNLLYNMQRFVFLEGERAC